MKDQLESLLLSALESLRAEGLAVPDGVLPLLTRAKDRAHGDFACNIAMQLAKPLGMAPRAFAERFVAALPQAALLEKVEIAGPGFINFYVRESAVFDVVRQALALGERYGRSAHGAGKKVMVEFVSANPTGPLHVGHGRGAAYGAAVADLLAAVGFDVHREYYVNDAGRQMHILATSVWLRYLELCGATFAFPSNGYKSIGYIYDIAQKLRDVHGDAFAAPIDAVFAHIPADEPQGGDKDVHIDALIERAQALLGDVRYREVFDPVSYTHLTLPTKRIV